MAQRTWARWKDGSIGRIDRDLRARMAILMGIHKGLRYLFTDPARGYAWIRKPNAAPFLISGGGPGWWMGSGTMRR